MIMKKSKKTSVILIILTFCIMFLLNTCDEGEYFPTGLPEIRIDTLNSAQILDRETWVTMTFSLTDPVNPSNNISAIDDQQIRGRGNASWTQTPQNGKKPYRIRFKKEQSVFGLPAARNWVLIKNGEMLNTSFGFELGKRLGLKYTCSYHHVHLYLNGDYRGLYFFTEHRQADPAGIGAPGRPKVDSTDGWFVEIDRYYDEAPLFSTDKYNLPIMIKTPEDNEVTQDGWAFGDHFNNKNTAKISQYPKFNNVVNDWKQITDLMAANDFPNNGYRELIDIDSFVKYFIVQTLVKNNDLFRPGVSTGKEIGSVYFYKDKNGKIGAGPIWDLDWSFAPWEFEGEKFLPTTAPYQIHPWFARFHEDPAFQKRYKEIWNENYYTNILTMEDWIDKQGAKIKSGAEKNQERWKEGDIDWHIGHIKDYFNKRVKYLNNVYQKIN